MAVYLVTGGAGFIGSHVVDLLAGKGHKVHVLDNFSTGKKENLSSRENVQIWEGDVCDDVKLLWIFKLFQYDAVIHLAAQAAISIALQNPYKDLNVNAMGTLTLLKITQKFDVKKFIFASTSAVYSDNILLPIPEVSPYRPGNPYGVSKAAAEMYVRLADMETTILRLGNVYGPRQVPIGENQVIARMMRHLVFGDEFKIFGDGKQKRDFVYVEDVAQAVEMAIEGKAGVYNIAGGQSYSVNDIAKIAAKAAGKSVKWKFDRKRQDERRNIRLIIDKAEHDLGWQPRVGIVTGLKKTLDWWRKQ